MSSSCRITLLFSLIISFFSGSLIARQIVVSGDKNAQKGATFSIPMGVSAVSTKNETIFLGAAQEGAEQYSLAVAKGSVLLCDGIATSSALVNEEQKANPLFNVPIKALDVLEIENMGGSFGGYKPVVVTQAKPGTIYMIERYASVVDANVAPMKIWELGELKDASGINTVNSVVALKTIPKGNCVFAAVTGKDGQWGSEGSGIAFIERTQLDEDIEDADGNKKVKTVHLIHQVDVGNDIPVESVVRSAPLDLDSDVIKIGGSLSSLGEVVSLYWDEDMKRLFVGLDATAGADENDGVRSVVVGHIDYLSYTTDGKDKEGKKIKVTRHKPVLRFYPCAPAGLFEKGKHSVLGGCGTNVHVVAKHIQTMTTSTGLKYLIVEQEYDENGKKDHAVYAVPLVSNNPELQTVKSRITELNKTIKDLSEQKKAEREVLLGEQQKLERCTGTLANVTENPCDADQFNTKAPYRLRSRGFSQPAEKQAQCIASLSPSARIGEVLPEGTVSSISLHGDVVYVTIIPSNNGSVPSVYSSRALFDEAGRIKNWTSWQRSHVATDEEGSPESIQRFVITQDGTQTLLTGDTSIQTIKKSRWSSGEDNEHSLARTVNDLFKDEKSGVQHLVTIPAYTTGMAMPLVCALSNHSFGIFETEAVVDGLRTPRSGSKAYQPDLLLDYKAFAFFENRGLEKIAPLTTVVSVETADGVQCLVGGVRGIAWLDDGCESSWQSGLSVGQQLSFDNDRISFKKISDWPLVKKMVVDGHYLYVLTDKKLMRLDMNCVSCDRSLDEQEGVVELASAENLPQANTWSLLTDVIVSGDGAFLATSKGLFESALDVDIRTAQTKEAVRWHAIEVPGALETVTKLMAISVTGNEVDVARHGGGMLYVVTSHRGKNKSYVTRFSIADSESTQDGSRLKRLPDKQVRDSETPYLDLYGYRGNVVSDGTLHFMVTGRNGEQRSRIELLPIDLGTKHVTTKKVRALPLHLDDDSTISAVSTVGATGEWLVAGNFGVYSNS